MSFWSSFFNLFSLQPGPNAPLQHKLHSSTFLFADFSYWKDTCFLGSLLLGYTRLHSSTCYMVSDLSDFQTIFGVILDFKCLINAWFAFQFLKIHRKFVIICLSQGLGNDLWFSGLFPSSVRAAICFLFWQGSLSGSWWMPIVHAATLFPNSWVSGGNGPVSQLD